MLVRIIVIASCLLTLARAGHTSCEQVGFFVPRGSTPIVYGVVEGHRDPEKNLRSLDLRVLRVLQGHDTRTTVRLWNGPGQSGFTERFPVGRKLVVALAGNGALYGLPEASHVLESECATHFVRVRESKDDPGMWLSDIERRLATVRAGGRPHAR